MGINKYLISALLIAGVGVYTLYNMYTKARNNSIRWENNYTQLNDSSKTKSVALQLKLSEFKEQLDASTDSILKLNNIPPRIIKEIEYIKITDTIRDTIEIPLIVKHIDSTRLYTFEKKLDCFTTAGYIQMIDTVPKLYITYQAYNNDITEITYFKRRKYNFLLWKWRLFGKKQYYKKSIPICGETSIKSITITKE